LGQINMRHFENRRVITMDLGYMYVHTLEIPSPNIYTVENGVGGVYVTTQPAYAASAASAPSGETSSIQSPILVSAEYSHYGDINNSHYALVAQEVELGNIQKQGSHSGSKESSVSIAIRQMSITVPAGVIPGSTITAVSPEGISVQVVIPYGSYPGQIINVRY